MEVPEPGVFRLDNGLQVVASAIPDAPTIAVCACVRAGPVYETAANNGVSHLLEHLHLATSRSCPTRSEFSEAARRLTVGLDGHTEPDSIVIRFSVAPDQFERGLTFLSEMVETRPFSAEAIASERRLIMSELRTTQAGSQHTVFTWLFDSHAFGLPWAGTRRSVSRLRPEAVECYERAAFSPERIVVGLAGPLPTNVQQLAGGALGRLQTGHGHELKEPVAPALALPRIKVSSSLPLRYDWQMCGFAFDGPLTPQERAAQTVLEHWLVHGSVRLLDGLRYGTTSAYDFGGGTQRFLATRVMLLWVRLPPAQRDPFLTAVLAEINQLRNPDAQMRSGLAQLLAGARVSIGQQLRVPEYLAYSQARELAHAGAEAAMFVPRSIEALLAVTADDLAGFVNSRCRLDRFFAMTGLRVRLLDDWRLRRMIEQSFRSSADGGY